MAAWVPKPCKGCGGPSRQVRGARYCDNCVITCGGVHDGTERRYKNNTCIGCHNAQMKAAYLRSVGAYKDRVRSNELRNKYGLTKEQHQEMLKHGCAICGSMNDPNVDHDHKTGVVRGILCGNCNRGLGLFADDPERMQRAVEYLREGGDAPMSFNKRHIAVDLDDV